MNSQTMPTNFQAVRTKNIDNKVTSTLVTLGLDDLSAGDLIIRNRFAGINYKDCLAIQGKAKIISTYPRVAGIELVGEVVHSSVDEFSVGQTILVHGFSTGSVWDGGFSEYVRVPANHAMLLPKTLSAWQAAAIGVPGFTAAMALDKFQQYGINVDSGPVAVNGATGAVGLFALSILSQVGYNVSALTRRAEDSCALLALGASEIVDTSEIQNQTRPLEKARFAAAIDNVSGPTLSWMLRSLQDGGVLASVGNASGNSFEGSVLPFILRRVQMFGVVANAPWNTRQQLWARLATDWCPNFSKLEGHLHTIELKDLLDYSERHLAGATTGRTLIRF